MHSAVFSGGAGGARAPPEFGGSQKGQSLISAYQSLAIKASKQAIYRERVPHMICIDASGQCTMAKMTLKKGSF